MIDQGSVPSLMGSTVRDSAGDKIGKVGQVYLDDTTGQPEWVTVRTGLFGTRESFVPLAAARVEGDEVCVAEQENGAACNDNYECKSRYCVAPSDATAKTCMAVPTPQCFYGGGCAAAGGAPRLASLLVMGLFVAVALLRARRRGHSRPRARSR